MDNAAFGDPEENQWHQEAARILRAAAKRIEQGDDEFQLRDENGNLVGHLSTNSLRNSTKSTQSTTGAHT